MKIASFNCRGLNRKVLKIIELFYLLELDVLCLQESYIVDDETKNSIERHFKFKYHNGNQNSMGVAVILRKSLHYVWRIL